VRPLALLLALIVALPFVPQARADEPVIPECALPADAPANYLRVRWRGPGVVEGGGVPGFWVSDASMQKIAEDADKCKNALTTCIVDLEVQKATVRSPGWWTWGVGVAAGVAIGFFAAEKFK